MRGLSNSDSAVLVKRASGQYNAAMTSPRTAVVLCNLGGPDSLEAVEPFLRNLFSDPDIFQFPAAAFTQGLFARLVAWRRREEASRGYAALGGASPIGANTQDQAWALEQVLADLKARVFVCMRYWHPLTGEVVAALKAGGVRARRVAAFVSAILVDHERQCA